MSVAFNTTPAPPERKVKNRANRWVFVFHKRTTANISPVLLSDPKTGGNREGSTFFRISMRLHKNR